MEQRPMMTAESLKSFNRWRWGVALALLALLILLPLFTSIGPNSWRHCAEREGLLGSKSGAAVATAGAVTAGAGLGGVAANAGAASGDVNGAALAVPDVSGPAVSVPSVSGASVSGASRDGAAGSLDLPASGGVASGTWAGGVPPSERVYFSTARSTPRGYPTVKLADIVSYLNANPNAKVIVQGFHDPRGDVGFNRELANKRAGSVEAILTKLGVSPDRIIVNPEGDVLGSGGLAEARRVEVTVAG